MRAMMLTGLRRMAAADVPAPRLARDTDVLLRVGVVGICGSDIHYHVHGRIGSQVVEYPYRVGHEFAGTVMAVGAAVRDLRVGDRVAVDPAMPCGQCDQCRCGREHTCRALRFLGCPGQADGCLADEIVMPAACCVPVGADASLEAAALAEPLSIGIYAMRLAALPPGARLGILGAGPIGLCVQIAARAAGHTAIYVTDPIAPRRETARRLGATWTGDPEREDVVAAVTRAEPLLLDAVFECCGQQAALDQAVELLKPGGKLMVVGIPAVDRITFAIDRLRRREICIQNVRRQNGCLQAAVDLIASGAVPLDPLITHRFPFDQTPEAFELVAAYRDGVVKAMVFMGD